MPCTNASSCWTQLEERLFPKSDKQIFQRTNCHHPNTTEKINGCTIGQLILQNQDTQREYLYDLHSQTIPSLIDYGWKACRYSSSHQTQNTVMTATLKSTMTTTTKLSDSTGNSIEEFNASGSDESENSPQFYSLKPMEEKCRQQRASNHKLKYLFSLLMNDGHNILQEG